MGEEHLGSKFDRTKNWLTQNFISTNEATRWSSLAALGNSKVAQLTVLAPFVGHLVFYNYLFAEYFFNASGSSDEQSWFVRLQGEHRLSLLYIGLVLFGSAAALYAIFAPRTIKRHPAVESYLREVDEVATYSMTISALDRLVEAHPAGRWECPETPAPDGGFIWFPLQLEIECDKLLTFLGEQVEYLSLIHI